MSRDWCSRSMIQFLIYQWFTFLWSHFSRRNPSTFDSPSIWWATHLSLSCSSTHRCPWTFKTACCYLTGLRVFYGHRSHWRTRRVSMPHANSTQIHRLYTSRVHISQRFLIIICNRFLLWWLIGRLCQLNRCRMNIQISHPISRYTRLIPPIICRLLSQSLPRLTQNSFRRFPRHTILLIIHNNLLQSSRRTILA